MTIDDHKFTFAYNTWANERIFACLSTLQPDQLKQVLGGSFPSILSTVEHILAAEWVWLQRWQGDPQPAKPKWLPVNNLDDLIQVWQTLETNRNAFLSTLTDPDLKHASHYTFSSDHSGSSPLGRLLQHLINHSTYHRGQIAGMLRRLGIQPPSTDMVLFNEGKSV